MPKPNAAFMAAISWIRHFLSLGEEREDVNGVTADACCWASGRWGGCRRHRRHCCLREREMGMPRMAEAHCTRTSVHSCSQTVYVRTETTGVYRQQFA